MQLVTQGEGARQLRGGGPADDEPFAAPQDFTVVFGYGVYQQVRRLRAGLRGGEVRPLQVDARQARHVLRHALRFPVAVEKVEQLAVGAGEAGRRDGRGAVAQVRTGCRDDGLRRAVHKVAVPAAVHMQVDKAGAEGPAAAVHGGQRSGRGGRHAFAGGLNPSVPDEDIAGR